MRPSGLWNTYRHVHLERYLSNVPRAERETIRAHVAGKRIR